jgi:hypothetical protein
MARTEFHIYKDEPHKFEVAARRWDTSQWLEINIHSGDHDLHITIFRDSEDSVLNVLDELNAAVQEAMGKAAGEEKAA